MKSASLSKIAAAIALSAALWGCGQGDQSAKAPDAPAAQPASELERNFAVSGMRSGSFTIEGSVLTARRAEGGEGPVGVTLARVAGAANAAQVTFNAAGEEVRIRVRQGGQDGYVQRARENTIMIGPGGAEEVLIYTREGPRMTLNVSSIADCSSTQCAPATLRGE